jgi:hypothetical protein
MRRSVKPLDLQLILTVAVGACFLLTTFSLRGADAPATQASVAAAGRVSPQRSQFAQPASSGTVVLRESSVLLDRSGTVARQGGRLVFASADGRSSMVLLENRMLERVGRLLALQSTSPRLLVSGTVTEYHKRNYLLLTRVYIDIGRAE